MERTPNCVCAYCALLVLAAGFSGCQTIRSRTAGGDFEASQSVRELLAARPAVKNAGRAGEKPNDDAPASAGVRRAVATSNRTQGTSDLRSGDSHHPLSLALRYDKPDVMHPQEKTRQAEQSVRLASWSSAENAGLALEYSDLSQQQDDMPDSAQVSDLGEISKQINNPVGKLWMLFNQHDYTRFEDPSGESREFHSFKFQPVMPMQLTDEWRVIVRPVIPIVYNEVPQGRAGNWDREFGLGDVVLLTAFTTAKADSKWLWGVGPTWMFPTATDDALGTEKWSVGPAATVFYLGDKWILGGVWQNWFSFAGNGDRESVNLMDFQYVIQYRVTPTLQIGMTPNIQYDWAEHEWTVPVGFGGSKTFMFGKLPIRIGAEAQYYVHQPDDFGPEWNFRFFFIPVIPAPEWAGKPLFGS